MQMIYNSPSYCVFEFKEGVDACHTGFEIMDKTSRREFYLGGTLAEHFRDEVIELISDEPSIEQVDAFLSSFGGLMLQPLVLH